MVIEYAIRFTRDGVIIRQTVNPKTAKAAAGPLTDDDIGGNGPLTDDDVGGGGPLTDDDPGGGPLTDDDVGGADAIAVVLGPLVIGPGCGKKKAKAADGPRKPAGLDDVVAREKPVARKRP
jgi:hypothetical protein